MISKEVLLGNYETKFLICPKCKNSLLKENSKKSYNLIDYKIADKSFFTEYNMHEYSTKLKVSLCQCESSACNGEVVLIEEEKGELNPKNQPFFIFEYEPYIYKRTIKYMKPSVDIIDLPNQLNSELVEILKISFFLFWIDEDSCGNRIRSAIEKILDLQKINKTTINKNGKRVKLRLHQRIEKFKKKQPYAANYLFALKLLGNRASHNTKNIITRNQLVDAYQILELILTDLYDKKRTDIKRLTKKIIGSTA